MIVTKRRTTRVTTAARWLGANATALTLAGLAFFAMSPSVEAGNLVQNGSFESLTCSGISSGCTNGLGNLGYNTNASNWTTSGYNFVFTAAAATNVTSNGTDQIQGVDGGLALWGPSGSSLGSPNGDPDNVANGLGPSPDGGNFVGADGAYETGAITQTINGLTKGNVYAVSFWYAGAQQYTFNGNTTEAWIVDLGGAKTQETTILNDVSNGFTGWKQATMYFTADSTSDVLSFLAVGTPGSSQPPFSLLDGVSVTQAPEPTLYVAVGLVLVGLVFFRRRQLLSKQN